MPRKMISMTEAANLLYTTGLLGEINRKILHPFGLALSVNVNDQDVAENFVGIFDSRDDPKGYVFTPETLEELDERLDRFMSYAGASMLESRKKALGYVVQPLPGADS